MEKITSCPLCDSQGFVPFVETRDHFLTGEPFTISECTNCKFLFTNPRPEESKSAQYYKSEEYISHSNTDQGIISRIYKLVRNYSLSKKVRLIKKFVRGGSALDIGCGTGHFLSVLAKNGFEVTGVEPGDQARNSVRAQFGIDVYNSLEPLKSSDKKFEVITLWHVLEHIYPLKENVRQISGMLSENGILVVAVPNPESYDAKHYNEFCAAYDLPRHLYQFKKSDIKKLFLDLNFDLLKTFPMKFDSYYVSLLSEKYKSGKNNYMKAFFTGLKSNWIASSKNNYSSLIYVLKLKNS